DIVMVGGGGHAKVILGVLRKLGTHAIVGYTDGSDPGPVLGVPHLGSDDALPGLIGRRRACAAALGGRTTGISDRRGRTAARLEALGFELPAIVSGDAIVGEDVTIGPGTFVAEGVVVNPGAAVGRFCILNTHCTVEHDCRLGDFVHIAPAAVLSGGV